MCCFTQIKHSMDNINKNFPKLQASLEEHEFEVTNRISAQRDLVRHSAQQKYQLPNKGGVLLCSPKPAVTKLMVQQAEQAF